MDYSGLRRLILPDLASKAGKVETNGFVPDADPAVMQAKAQMGL